MSFKRLPRDTKRIRVYGRKGEFPQIEPGEPYRLSFKRKDLRMACCDCGLIHRFRFNVRRGQLIIRSIRSGKLRKAKRSAPVLPCTQMAARESGRQALTHVGVLDD